MATIITVAKHRFTAGYFYYVHWALCGVCYILNYTVII